MKTIPAFYTNQQYLNGDCTHREFYAQFVNDTILSLVNRRFGKERLTEALKEEEHLNSIPLREWDMLANSMLSYSLGLGAKMKERGTWLTQACCVCILKEAARQIIES